MSLTVTSSVASTSALSAVLINGRLTQTASLELSGGRLKKFVCSYEGCGKAYTRPTRLEEHIRSHTGEKPFGCGECGASFGRESHLKAHERTHKGEEDKTHICSYKGCGKKFWTTQHVKKHEEVVHKGKTYDCAECDEKFRKHNQLRTHVAEAHSPPGTFPFKCDKGDCDKSFKQKTHLTAHLKTHDLSRYMCSHSACLGKPLEERQFAMWSSLQKHYKNDHPPICPHEECKGKTFTTRRGLRNHLESVHATKEAYQRKKRGGGKRKRMRESEEDTDAQRQLQQENESEWEERMESEREERFENAQQACERRESIKRRRFEETPWACDQGNCKKRFKSLVALETHVQLKHAPDTDELGPPVHDPPSAALVTLSSLPMQDKNRSGVTGRMEMHQRPMIDLITGANYHAASYEGGLERVYNCPFPGILEILPHEQALAIISECQKRGGKDQGRCALAFKRVYDVERHLKSAHEIELSREEIQEWYDDQVGASDDEGAQCSHNGEDD